MTSKSKTYDESWELTQRQTPSRSRLRTLTGGMPEIYPQAELSHKILIVGGARCGKSALSRFYA